MQELLEIMARLRAPDGGCPWDQEQTFKTIAPYTLEEAYEVADAIERGDMDELQDELGDLLFQVAFYAQMAREQGLFEYEDILRGICDKMIRRHPHVFADHQVKDAEEQTLAWEALKAEERADRADSPPGQLDGVTLGLPALIRGEKLQRRAAKVGFDWPDVWDVLSKVHEEVSELTGEMEENGSPDRLEEEVGDLLFSCVNLARHLGVDAEQALRRANSKFERRFSGMEQLATAQAAHVGELSVEELDILWTKVKEKEQ
ncbi:MAG: nucleoside triphosphate pyrophosphohydrolase [Gammaproteobacteria bacterium]|nr:nucleoside triphosphate pyrophosphohydrolase [Gammaproteobacteria bacterium]